LTGKIMVYLSGKKGKNLSAFTSMQTGCVERLEREAIVKLQSIRLNECLIIRRICLCVSKV
jgi:hypothetical protein